MRLPALILFSVFLATTVAAQTSIPSVLLPEARIAPPLGLPIPFSGNSAIASNGESFLVVTVKELYRFKNTFSFRLAVTLVDSEGRRLTEWSHMVDSPCGGMADVASDGDGYLVVFGCSGVTRGLLVSREGAVRQFDIHAGLQSGFGERRVAWDGMHYVVMTTLQTLNAPPAEIATRISASGEIVRDRIPIPFAGVKAIAARNGISVLATGDAFRTMNAADVVSAAVVFGPGDPVALAAGDDGFLLVWQGSDETIRAWHLDPSGRPDRAPFAVASAKALRLAVTAELSSFRVVWNDAAGAIRAVRVGTSGVLESPAVVATGERVAVTSEGGTTVIAWTDDTTRVRDIDARGAGRPVHQPLGRQIIDQFGLGAGGPTVTWTEAYERPGESGLWSRLLKGVGPVPYPARSDAAYTLVRGLDRPLLVSGSAPEVTVRLAEDPAVTFTVPSRRLLWTGDALLSIWGDRAPDNDPFAPMPLWAQRFDLNGNAIDAAPLRIGTSLDLERNFVSPAALNVGVFAGASSDRVLIAYIDPSASMQGVMLVGGTVLPIGEIAPAQALANPIEITSDGEDFIVTWISGMNGSNAFIASRRVLASGEMPFLIALNSPGGETKDAMATFWTGEHYLVVWATVVPEGRRISALRLARDGRLLDYPPEILGTVEGMNMKFGYRNGVLALAYERDGLAYWRSVATLRRRAIRS